MGDEDQGASLGPCAPSPPSQHEDAELRPCAQCPSEDGHVGEDQDEAPEPRLSAQSLPVDQDERADEPQPPLCLAEDEEVAAELRSCFPCRVDMDGAAELRSQSPSVNWEGCSLEDDDFAVDHRPFTHSRGLALGIRQRGDRDVTDARLDHPFSLKECFKSDGVTVERGISQNSTDSDTVVPPELPHTPPCMVPSTMERAKVLELEHFTSKGCVLPDSHKHSSVAAPQGCRAPGTCHDASVRGRARPSQPEASIPTLTSFLEWWNKLQCCSHT